MEKPSRLKKKYHKINILLITLIIILSFSQFIDTKMWVTYYIRIIDAITIGILFIFNGLRNGCTKLQKNKKVFPKWSWWLLVIPGTWFFVAAFTRHGLLWNPPSKINQQIVFINIHVNWAWGYQNHGYYIDNKGNIIKFDLSKEDKKYADMSNLLEYLETQNNPTVSNTISTLELNKYYNYLNKINPNTKLIEGRGGADMGGNAIYGVTYNSDGKPNFILIDEVGDVKYKNPDPYAKKITYWLRMPNDILKEFTNEH